MGGGGDGAEAEPLIKEARPDTPEEEHEGPGGMIEQMVGNLTAIESRMNDDVNAFKDKFSEILRQAAANLRPMARVEYILPLQGGGSHPQPPPPLPSFRHRLRLDSTLFRSSHRTFSPTNF